MLQIITHNVKSVILIFFCWCTFNGYAQPLSEDSCKFLFKQAAGIIFESDYTSIDSIKLNQALEITNQLILNGYTNDANIRFIRGELYNHLRKRELAINELYKTIELVPCELVPYSYLHQILWTQLLKKTKAKELRALGFKNIMECMGNDTLNPQYWYNLGIILDLNEYETEVEKNQIIMLYQKSLNLDSTNYKCWFDLSCKFEYISQLTQLAAISL